MREHKLPPIYRVLLLLAVISGFVSLIGLLIMFDGKSALLFMSCAGSALTLWCFAEIIGYLSKMTFMMETSELRKMNNSSAREPSPKEQTPSKFDMFQDEKDKSLPENESYSLD